MYPFRRDPGLRSNKLTAPQPEGSVAQNHLMTTETRHEDLILPQALKTNNHEVLVYYDFLRAILQRNNTLEAGSVSVRLFQTRGKCQDFIARKKDDVIHNAINSPFSRTSTAITMRQSRSIEDRENWKTICALVESVG